MGLFQKKPQTSNSAPLYTLGLNKTVVVVGLGNPGKAYEMTRHNLGFICVDELAKQHDFENWVQKKDLKCLESKGTIGSTRVIAIKPTTFMNLSGEAVQAVMQFYKVTNSSVVVVHDELDVPFGQIRVRSGGSAAGHNGIKSLIQHIGEDFNRIRVGIGSAAAMQQDSASYVLEKLTTDEQQQLPNLTREVTSMLTEFIASGTLPHDTRTFLV